MKNNKINTILIIFILIICFFFILRFIFGFLIYKSRQNIEKFISKTNLNNSNKQEETKENIFNLKYIEDSDELDPIKKSELKELEKEINAVSDVAKMLGINGDELVDKKNEKEFNSWGDAPNIIAKDIYDDDFILSEFIGNVIILDFFATWCPPCIKEIPHFINLLNKYEDKGLRIVGISCDNDKEIVKFFKKKNNILYPIVMLNEKIIKDYKLGNAIPETFIINKKGDIVKRFVGFKDESTFEKEIINII